MAVEVSDRLPTFWSDDSVPSSSVACGTAMVMLSFGSDDSVPSSRAACDLREPAVMMDTR